MRRTCTNADRPWWQERRCRVRATFCICVCVCMHMFSLYSLNTEHISCEFLSVLQQRRNTRSLASVDPEAQAEMSFLWYSQVVEHVLENLCTCCQQRPWSSRRFSMCPGFKRAPWCRRRRRRDHGTLHSRLHLRRPQSHTGNQSYARHASQYSSWRVGGRQGQH